MKGRIMKKSIRKGLVFFLALSLSLCGFQAVVFADDFDEIIYEETDENEAPESVQDVYEIEESDTSDPDTVLDDEDDLLIDESETEDVEDDTRQKGDDALKADEEEKEEKEEKEETEEKEGTLLDTNGTYFDVTDFGADGTDGKDDRAAINKALALANSNDQPITVYIPDGKYYISASLFIFSDTVLQLGANAVICSSADYQQGPMIIGTHLGSDNKVCKCSVGNESTKCNGYGYTKCGNITIDGGTWIASLDKTTGLSSISTIVAIRHAHDITVKNMTCRNAAGHAVNLSGVNNGLVSNVTFLDANPGSEKDPDVLDTKEFVHLDYCESVGEPSYGIPYDNTPAKNITVENCSFTNGFSGVGNHHDIPKGAEISSNINVKDCTFNNLEFYAVAEFSVDGLTVQNCSVSDAMTFAEIRGASNVKVLNNTFDACGAHKYDSLHKDRGGINVTQSSDVIIQGNTVKNTTNSTISVTNASNVNIKSNKCSGAGTDGIAVKGVTGGTIASNTVSSAKGYGLEYRSTTGMKLSKNKITGTKSGLYIVGDSENGKSLANVVNNTLKSTKGDDLYIGVYSDNCYFSGNKLVNYSCTKIAEKFKGTILPKMKTIVLQKKSYAYTGSKLTPKVVVKDVNGRKLVENQDYWVTYTKSKNVGTANIKVEGKAKSAYAGQIVKTTFKVVPKKIKPKVVVSPKSFVFDGKCKMPEIKVYDGKKLLPGGQYKVTYHGGRKQVGTYTIDIKLRKNYSGSKKVSFTIKKATQKMTVTVPKSPVTVEYSSSKATYIPGSSVFTIKNAQGEKSFTLTSGNKAYFAVSKKTGQITVNPKTPKGTYALKIKVTASGGKSYKPKSKTKSITIKVK